MPPKKNAKKADDVSPPPASVPSGASLGSLIEFRRRVEKLEILTVSSGATWNADVVLAFTENIQKIMEFWPGIYEETPTKIGDGGSQDSRLYY